MILEQYYLGCLAHASYIIGDEESGNAVVVAPPRAVARYVETAARNNLQIRQVFLTHFHADFVAGHLELRDRTGARIHLGARAHAEYAFEPMADGSTLQFGNVRLKVLQTPGHSPEYLSLLVGLGEGGFFSVSRVAARLAKQYRVLSRVGQKDEFVGVLASYGAAVGLYHDGVETAPSVDVLIGPDHGLVVCV